MRTSFPFFTATAVLIGVLVLAWYFLKQPEVGPEIAPESKPEYAELSEPEPQPEQEEPISGEIERDTESLELLDETRTEPVKPEAPPFTGVKPPETLDNSDPVVKKALLDLSPKLAQWLVPEEQVRKWVLAVDKLAEGQLPKRYRPIEYPTGKFQVKKYAEVSVMEDANYARLKPLITAITAIDPDDLAAYYQAWKPLLENAYSQQGEPGTFEDQLLKAIDHFLLVKPLGEKGLLVQPNVLYEYQNEDLEAASDVQKLSWRMGEENTILLQTYARYLRNRIVEQRHVPEG